MPAKLTLGRGTLPARFQEIDMRGEWRLAAEQRRAWERIQATWPDLMGLKGDDFRAHPQANDYLDRSDWWQVVFPAIMVAWAGEGAAPTLEVLEASSRREIIDCAREVVRLNPDLTLLSQIVNPPEATIPAAPPEAADPNA